ncbi:MAG: hypothetical protein A3D10_02535 [Omnitrophica WOR_2 bacterium RIFCSPHIGHO2_02_FULL_48_11]|nr:MAG: hypothetical protein A3D10_02535 [Omnitrophica WOR_2 bacterium RIFCSPHIGHO2_02_FULL_48_11]
MNYEDWISYRYLTASKGRFLSFLNFISIAGVAVGVTALIVVTGIMTGFGNNLRDKIVGTTPHVIIEKETGVHNFAQLIEKLQGVEEIVGASPFIQGNVFLEESGQATGLVIRGIKPETEVQVTKVNEYMVEGDFKDIIGDNVVIGAELARYFGFKLGDKITLIAPGSGLAGQGWRYDFKIAGIFKSGMVDFDMNLVVVNLVKAQSIFGVAADTVTGVGIKLKDPYLARGIKQKIYDIVGYSFLVKTWIDVNRNLFDALYLEKWGLFFLNPDGLGGIV